MVGDGVLQALVRRRHAAGGAVVVRPVVEADAPAAGRVHHRRDRRDAVGAEDRLRGLHLDLEPQPARGEPVRLLQPLAHLDRRPHLVGRGDLGQGDQEAVRQRAGVEQGAEDEIERPQAAPAGCRLQALDSDAGERRARRRGEQAGQGSAGGRRGRVLLGVGAGAVAVLEVHPQVLHRLAGQLGPHPAVHVLVDAAQTGDPGRARRIRHGRVQHVEGRRPPPCRGVDVGLVRRHIDGVQRLPAAGIARVAAGEQPVRLGEPAVDAQQEGRVEPPRRGGSGGPLSLVHWRPSV